MTARLPAAMSGRMNGRSQTQTIEIQIPPGVRVTGVPFGVRFSAGPIRYQSECRLRGRVLTATRDILARRSSPVCGANDDRNWNEFLKVLQRDLRRRALTGWKWMVLLFISEQVTALSQK